MQLQFWRFSELFSHKLLRGWYVKLLPASWAASPSVTCVASALPLYKRRGILLVPGAFWGAFQKNDTCFPLSCCVCDLWRSVFLVRMGGGARNSPALVNYPTEKQHFENDTGRARYMGEFHSGWQDSYLPPLRHPKFWPIPQGYGRYDSPMFSRSWVSTVDLGTHS